MKKILILLIAFVIATGSLCSQSYSKELEKKANGGDTEAMIELGDAYYKGNGTKQDAKKAEKWYKKAINKDNIKGYSRIAELYTSWDGLEKNPEKQEEWLLKAAKAGDPEWANFYGNKRFDEKRYAEAQSFFEKAIKGGVTDSSGKLAYCQMLSQKLFDALITAEMIGENINEQGSSDYYGDQARKRAYAQLGRHDLVGTLSRNDLLETVIYCTGLKFDSLNGDEIKILEALKSVEFYGRTPEYTYLKAIGALLSDRRSMAVEFFEKAFEQGYENAGIALYGLGNIYLGFQRFVAEDPLLDMLSIYPIPDYPCWPIRHTLEASKSSNQDFLGNKPNHRNRTIRDEVLDGIRRDWAKNGNGSALSYLAKKQNMTFHELATEMNCFEALAQRGNHSVIVYLYNKNRNSNPDKAAYWEKCIHIAMPVSDAAACAYLYHQLYKNDGDSGTIEFIDYVMQENPEYLIQWIAQDKKLGKSDKVSILRMAAADTSEENRNMIKKVLKEKYSTTL